MADAAFCLAPDVLAAAQVVHEFLSEVDVRPESSADAVIGFGTFDVTLASCCGDLYAAGLARRIVFTGGIGAGTTDLGMPEADAWSIQLAATHPAIRPADIILENRSTNTAENITFTAKLLAENHTELRFGRGLNHALIVASPSRLRRVKLTLQHLHPDVRTTRCLPVEANFAREFALYEAKRIDYLGHLAGEVERLATYSERGWIAAEALPSKVMAAHAVLRRRS